MADLTLNLAWTVDDGPTVYTNAMIQLFDTVILKKPVPATWYVQWDYLEQRPQFYSTYRTLQARGHEIAIHGVSAVANHMHWFPTGNKEHQAFASIDQAIGGIAAFQKHLVGKEIHPKFVRAPTGLVSEISAYLRKLGIQDPKRVDSLARTMIAKKPLAEADAKQVAIAKVRADIETLRTKLPGLGLHMWGGASTDSFSAQSWEAESAAPNKGRTDSLPKYAQTVIDQLHRGIGKKERSLVLLCHDTSEDDVKEVRADFLILESYAKERGVTIKYHTMSSLFQKVVGVAP